jgi:hypothetical protein
MSGATEQDPENTAAEQGRAALRARLHYHTVMGYLHLGEWRSAADYLDGVAKEEGNLAARNVCQMIALATGLPVDLDEYDG